MNLLKVLSLTICVAISSCGIAAGQDSSPSLVLALYIVTPGDPFNTQQPAFALYSDNKTIFRKRSVIFSKDLIQTDTPSFFRATVDDKEKRRLTDLADSMCKLSAGYSASGRTHLPLNVVWYRGSETRRIVVYGDLSPEASTMMGDTSKVPAEFMRVYKELSEYSHAGETAWIPDQIECLMEPIGAARSGLAEWPASLAQDVATRQDEVVCAVFPQEHLMAAKRLLNANGGQINFKGRLWIGHLRFRFPDTSQVQASVWNVPKDSVWKLDQVTNQSTQRDHDASRSPADRRQ